MQPFWQGRRGRTAVVASFLIVMAGLLAMPVQGYLAQRSTVAGQEAELARLRAANDDLAGRIGRLNDPAEIERIARREYGLVEVGEESYTILPPGTAGLVLPRAWPFDRVDDAIARASARP
jgi:cell division protein FtsB